MEGWTDGRYLMCVMFPFVLPLAGLGLLGEKMSHEHGSFESPKRCSLSPLQRTLKRCAFLLFCHLKEKKKGEKIEIWARIVDVMLCGFTADKNERLRDNEARHIKQTQNNTNNQQEKRSPVRPAMHCARCFSLLPFCFFNGFSPSNEMNT